MSGFVPRLLAVSTPEQAERELQRIGVDSIGIREMVPKMRSVCVEFAHLQCRQANILKQEMLSLGGDAAVARGTVACAVDRTDCILIGTVKQLLRLSRKLKAQPFSLSLLGDSLSALLGTFDLKPETWRTSRRSLSLQKPLIMGILNITPDSFSDGGEFNTIEKAVSRARQMEADGADIIDIGGESTRPGAAAVGADEEMSRVLPIIERLADVVQCAISVDTWKSEVAEKALQCGAEIVNDISGFTFDRNMPGTVAMHSAGVVLMHTRGRSDVMQNNTGYDDLMADISAYLHESILCARSAGISDECIAIDPGIGFGKDAVGNLEILRRLPELTGFSLPILTGPSRKSFIGTVLGRGNTDDRLFGTAAAVAISVSHGASILRVHDVKAMRDVADLAHAIMHS